VIAGLPVRIGLAACLVLIGVGCRETAEVPAETVQRTSFRRTLQASGFLEARDATPLVVPINLEQMATLAWLKEDGHFVEEGEVVIRFDPTPLEKDLDDGLAERRSQESRIVSTRVMGTKERKNLDRDAEMADLELGYAKEFQTSDAEIYSKVERIESEIDAELAGRKKSYAETTRGVRDALNRVEVELLEIGKERAQSKIDRAEKSLLDMTVTAPHDGIFVIKNQWGGKASVGEQVWRGQQVGEIPALEAMEAEVWVLEADAGGLEEGAAASVRIEADPGRPLMARVKSVSKLPSRRWRRNPAQFFKLILEFVELEKEDATRLKPGTRVLATLILDAREDVMTVPRTAVFMQDGVATVRRWGNGNWESVAVTTGPANLGRVVIESGLEEGDRIALGDPDSMAVSGGDSAGEKNGPVSGAAP
jgi:multidrug efflux pump subunit AcrA (membrane-fusion protein)